MHNLILLQAASGAAPAGGFGMSSLIMTVMIIAIFYFFMISPQQKKHPKKAYKKSPSPKGDRLCCFRSYVRSCMLLSSLTSCFLGLPLFLGFSVSTVLVSSSPASYLGRLLHE